jgi:hypothetical protein
MESRERNHSERTTDQKKIGKTNTDDIINKIAESADPAS